MKASILIPAAVTLLGATAAMAQTSRRYPAGARAPEVMRGRAVVNDRAAAPRPPGITATGRNATGNFGGPGTGGGGGGP